MREAGYDLPFRQVDIDQLNTQHTEDDTKPQQPAWSRRMTRSALRSLSVSCIQRLFYANCLFTPVIAIL